MTNYRKLITALVGLAVLGAARYGFDLSGQEQMIVDTLVSVLTAVGVYAAPNTAAA